LVSITRANRIAIRIHEELSEIILQRVADPRLLDISITEVKVDKELAFANVYFSALDGTSRLDEIMRGFESARGFLRSELALRINLRTFPRLRFHWDPTFEQAERIERLITSLKENNQKENNSELNNKRDKNFSSVEMEDLGSKND